jgi:hypothetical protein
MTTTEITVADEFWATASMTSSLITAFEQRMATEPPASRAHVLEAAAQTRQMIIDVRAELEPFRPLARADLKVAEAMMALIFRLEALTDQLTTMGNRTAGQA